ncbi:hypothetical protein ACN27G_32875 [Plantactinospora sp. WMMB334]|uniref:hypothetical protein n=1 Tax=Plantactinospora sp. WMMB334 TaxID=3404119 RepID=UPI003B95E54A
MHGLVLEPRLGTGAYLGALTGIEPTDATYAEIGAGDHLALWVRPLGAVAGRLILHAHGGRHISHDMTTSRKLSARVGLSRPALT